MGSMIEVGNIEGFENGTMKEIPVKGKTIFVARVGDAFYAADNRCAHMGGKLSQGKLEGTVVTCPKHGSQFDLKDGRVVRWLKGTGFVSVIGKALKSPSPLTTYNIKVADNKLMVEIRIFISSDMTLLPLLSCDVKGESCCYPPARTGYATDNASGGIKSVSFLGFPIKITIAN